MPIFYLLKRDYKPCSPGAEVRCPEAASRMRGMGESLPPGVLGGFRWIQRIRLISPQLPLLTYLRPLSGPASKLFWV